MLAKPLTEFAILTIEDTDSTRDYVGTENKEAHEILLSRELRTNNLLAISNLVP